MASETTVADCLAQWQASVDAKKEASTAATELGKRMKADEATLLEAMSDAGVDEVDLGGGRVLRVERKLKESKRERTTRPTPEDAEPTPGEGP
jgi:hypothetical protein